MGLKKKIVKSLIVWPPLVVGVGLAGLAGLAGTDDINTNAVLIFTAACCVGNAVYIIKS